ncbi:MAG: flagellar biosynthesis protein FlhB [Clostridiaceae bacterium]|nr:flagellar biosynthesis protein FlhB [Clostridiaceae bacterium]
MAYMKYNLQLFAKEGPGGEKTEEPTTKKLEDARKKGQVAKSVDFTSALSLLAFFGFLKVYIGSLGNQLLENYNSLLGHFADYVQDEFTLQIACALLGDVIMKLVSIIWPFLAVSFATTVAALLMQVKWKISAEPMKPKLSKISPLSGMKRMFSKDKLVMLVMSVGKIVIIVAVVYSYLKDKWNLIYDMYDYSLSQGIAIIGETIIDVGLRISMFFFVIGFADYLYQRWKHHNDMKMSKQEVRDEYKMQEGDPKVKGQQKQRMRQASQRRMMQELPNADVVITNPNHLAVALKYDKEKYDAPIVVAKGADYLANRIKDIARENKIEIVENKPLARMLYHNVEIGEQIPPELYQMVAEVLAYVYGLQGKA